MAPTGSRTSTCRRSTTRSGTSRPRSGPRGVDPRPGRVRSRRRRRMAPALLRHACRAAGGVGRPGRGAHARDHGARHGERAAARGPEGRARAGHRRGRRRASAHRGRPHRRGACPRDRAAGRGDRDRRDRPTPDLRERRLPMGVRGQVTRRPAPLVRHDLVRKPREGPSAIGRSRGRAIPSSRRPMARRATSGASPSRAAAGPRSRTRHESIPRRKWPGTLEIRCR